MSACGFLSEWDERPARDCTYASGVMVANDMGVVLPLGLTPAEREALERSDDRADETGASLTDLATGFARRYHVTVTPHQQTRMSFIEAMEADRSAVVQLLYSDLPIRYQRWDPAFAAKGPLSRHAVNARRADPDGVVRPGFLWLRDPLARGATWCGEWIGEAELAEAAAAFGGGYVNAIIERIEVEDVIDPNVDIPAAVCTVLPGGPLLASDKVTVITPSWVGGQVVGLYSRPRVTSGWAAIRYDRASGPAEDLIVAWVPNNKVTAVRVPDAPPDVKHVVTVAVDGVTEATVEV